MAGYGTDEGFLLWLRERGYELPDDAPSPAILRQLGSDYVDALYGRCFLGRPTGGLEQERAWPRTGAIVAGMTVEESSVPLAVVLSSYRAALMESQSPGSLITTSPAGRRVRRQKVEGIEREFFDDKDSTAPINSAIDGFLRNYVDHVCMGWREENGTLGIWAIGK